MGIAKLAFQKNFILLDFVTNLVNLYLVFDFFGFIGISYSNNTILLYHFFVTAFNYKLHSKNLL